LAWLATTRQAKKERCVMKCLFLGVVVFVLGCGGGGSGATCPTTSTLTYDNFGRSFMERYYPRCHAAGMRGPNLSTLATIQAAKDEIDLTTASGPSATNTEMPPGQPAPTTAERQQLGEWLACGAR
jgi:hypothetical protein